MFELPSWLVSGIKSGKYRCPHCDKVMMEKSVIGIGIRLSSKDKDNTVFYFDYLCHHCQHRSLVEMSNMTVEDFVSEMVQEYTEGADNEIVENIKSLSEDADFLSENDEFYDKELIGTKISEDEYKTMLRELDDCEYWDDFLIKIGFSAHEIEEYKKEGIKEFNERINGV